LAAGGTGVVLLGVLLSLDFGGDDAAAETEPQTSSTLRSLEKVSLPTAQPSARSEAKPVPPAKPASSASQAPKAEKSSDSEEAVDAEELFKRKAPALDRCSPSAEPQRIAPSVWQNVMPKVAKVPGEDAFIVGFASGKLDAVGLRVNADTLAAEEVFSETRPTFLTSVVPLVAGGKFSFMTARYGALENAIVVDAEVPFTLGTTRQGIGMVSSEGGGALLWGLPKKTGIRSLVSSSNDSGHAVVFRMLSRPGALHYGRLEPDGSKLTELFTAASGAITGPTVALQGDNALLAFSLKAAGQQHEELRVAHAEGDNAPSEPSSVETDPGGPGGPKKLPQLTALANSGFLLQWTEGGYGQGTIRAQVLSELGKKTGETFTVSTTGQVTHASGLAAHGGRVLSVYTEGSGTGRALYAALLGCH
jgi:hypothetical protein